MSKQVLYPRDVCRKLMKGEDLSSPEIPLQHNWYRSQAVYGMSALCVEGDKELQRIERGSQNCFNPAAKKIAADTVFDIASITKTFTVATILRMIESDEFAHFFPDKLNTKLKFFNQILKSRYPESEYVNTKLDKEDERISLQDLIVHTSGIGEIEEEDFYNKLLFASGEFLAKPADGKFLDVKRLPGEYGQFQYSDVGYELLGMVVSAIASSARQKATSFGEMNRELVIDRLNLKQTFTSDQVALIDGETKIKDAPKQEVAQGYPCKSDGTLTKAQGFRRCMSTSAMYSSPSELCKFASRVFGDKVFSDGGLFEKQATIDLRNSHKVQYWENGKLSEGVLYGIGYVIYENQDGYEVRTHGAQTNGYCGRLSFRVSDGKVSCCLVVSEQLTPYFARALLDLDIKEGRIDNNDLQAKQYRLYELNQELLHKYDKDELLVALSNSGYQTIFEDDQKIEDGNYESLRKELHNLDLKKSSAAQYERGVKQASGKKLDTTQEFVAEL